MIRALLIALPAWLCVLGVYAQCPDGQISLTMNVYTDSWGYETYWELVPGTNVCGDGTIVWGSNIEAVGCSGGGEYNAYGTESSYPSNSVINVAPICLTEGELYTLYFVDDYGDGGLYFELFENGNFSGFYAGTGIGNAWTFEAGNSFLGPNDSPCGAVEVVPGFNTAVDLTNFNCYTQVAEVQPPQGNCDAMGVWCSDEVSRTAWAKFVVPDDGAYEISTVHNGTMINTQIAVWIADDCADMSSFIYVSGNDDFIGESNVPVCNANAPACVDRASAAYLNVISTFPNCCETGWDAACQNLYDSMNASCADEVQTCQFLLEGFDSYGDGWNGCYLIVTIDGVSTEVTMTEGNYAAWPLDIIAGSSVSIEFVPADWPEEVFVSLKNADGIPLFNVQAITVDPVLFDDVVSCNGVEWFNPQASRCYTHCLPAGITCYIQIDGFDNQTGQIVLSVKPYSEPAATNVIITDVVCPVAVGQLPEGLILPNITGWGLNYESSWTGPNNFSSDAYFLENVGPGEYAYTASDLCGHVINETFVVEGPQPFLFNYTSSPTCPENADGTLSFEVSGGTQPYEFVWIYPDSSTHEGVEQSNLEAGTYYVYLIDANGCDVAMPAVVPALPQTQFSLGDDFEVCNNFDIQLAGPQAFDYLWSTGEVSPGILISDDEFAIGTHDISLTVINYEGCEYTDTITIEVLDCVALDELNANKILVYPNPATDELMVTNVSDQFEVLELRSITGELVYKRNITNEHNIRVGLYGLAGGSYLMTLMAGDNNVHHRVQIVR